MRDNAVDFTEVFLNDRPLMDVRAPVEFDKGAFAHAINRPLMNDSEREKVGTCYKQQGQQAAIELGHRLVSGELKQARIEQWAAFARQHPDGYLYCFRGGLRSQITQQWLKSEAGIEFPRISGGYKALRSFLLEQIEQAVTQCDFVLVGGLTGSGKTEVLAQLPNNLDLEGHANHRGSSFGRHATAQPSQISFENNLAVDVLKKRAAGHRQFVLEDEGRAVGSLAVPLSMFRKMQATPMVWLQDSLDSRVERILKDYVVDLRAEFVAVHGQEQGFERFADRLQQSLAAIVKRLGGERYQRLAHAMDNALLAQSRSGEIDGHREWISGLLGEYYDPMYAYQRDAKRERIEFAGDRAAVIGYLRDRQQRG
ncbi:MAG: tRNA 2-selenouridine(34) synthase MnmH [Pseudomonas sp.]|uniref:tRNA 2-selenouridine(34) synthase MnmH n=1 Tax=Pseudomonas abieticivorans TaxID=2931382 RepID=UPI0020BD60A1|nr:tRNA 2-selenouridine(34) synthase MnmH [Pseudomonas sp. PIA16]MDE1164654.1 tRNA 2-selenouridine(34) synthase MnmH [Pseudomonas sp.]